MTILALRRRNLEAELPHQFVDYLKSNKFATISKFRKQFHVTNPNRAKALLHKMMGQGLIVAGNDPRPGKKGIVFMLEQAVVKTRTKSKKYYDLQAGILEFLKSRPEGARSFEIPDHLGVARNDATMIKGLKELVSTGQITRTELGGRGRAVQYMFGGEQPKKPAKPLAATELATEEGPVIEYLLQKYEAALNRIEELQQQVGQSAAKLSAKPLPANLQARLKQLQAKDKLLTK